MRMDKDEIEIFKELIDKKYDRGAKPAPEKTAKKEAFQKASLEELLKEDEKKGLDPKLIMVMGGISFVVVFMLMIILGFGIIIGAAFGFIILLMAVVIVFLPNLQKGHVQMKHQGNFHLLSDRWRQNFVQGLVCMIV